MAAHPALWADEPTHDTAPSEALSDARWMPDLFRTIHALMTGPLPHDVVDGDYTTEVLFRASLVLNHLTGGRPDMTFSARCHRAARISRDPASRIAWRLLSSGIDVSCAILRGECDHCATAWANHSARGQGRTRHRSCRQEGCASN